MGKGILKVIYTRTALRGAYCGECGGGVWMEGVYFFQKSDEDEVMFK